MLSNEEEYPFNYIKSILLWVINKVLFMSAVFPTASTTLMFSWLINKVLPEDWRETTNWFLMFSEIDYISRRSTLSINSGSTLLKTLEYWISFKRKIKRRTELYSQWFTNKNYIFYIIYFACIQFLAVKKICSEHLHIPFYSNGSEKINYNLIFEIIFR